jgi:hypothetical protein
MRQLNYTASLIKSKLAFDELRKRQTQATQALAQVQKYLEEKHSATEWENIALQAKWDEEKAQLQQSKEQLLAKKLKVKEMVHRALRSVIVVEVKDEEQVPQ